MLQPKRVSLMVQKIFRSRWNPSARLSRLSRGCLTILLCASGSTAFADDGTLSDSGLNRAGLTSVWFTASGISSGGKIVDWTLNVNENKSTNYFVVKAGTYREIISQNNLSPFGIPYGLDGGVEYIETRKEVLEAELKSEGRADVKVITEQFSLPKSTIYILGNNGILTSIDADSGHQDWSVGVGSVNLPGIGIGASNDHVAAVNGSSLYCIEAVTGKVLWSQQCKFGVATSPAVSADHIYVPLLNGRMEIFEISKKGLGSYVLVAGGTGTARPLVGESTVSWSTDKGELNVSASTGTKQHSIRYRLLASDAILNASTIMDDLIFATSLDGFVYAIEEKGSLAWEFSTGSPISQSPFVLNDSVYAITDDKEMFRFDARNGDLQWPKPLLKVNRFIGASKDRLYVTDDFDSLLVIDPKSAAILSRVEIGDVRFALPNKQTDRLYVASRTGVIQCIHELGSPNPYFHGNELVVTEPTKSPATPMPDDATGSESAVAAEDDPFKTLDSSKATDQEKPQAAVEDEDDPFATGGDKKKADVPVDDPDDDPFGG